jgi:hypothetical protein
MAALVRCHASDSILPVRTRFEMQRRRRWTRPFLRYTGGNVAFNGRVGFARQSAAADAGTVAFLSHRSGRKRVASPGAEAA